MTQVAIVAVVVLLLAAALRLWLTANRLDRLHVRTYVAWLALEGVLARRIVAVRALVKTATLDQPVAAQLLAAATAADAADRSERASVETHLSLVLRELTPSQLGKLAEELADSAERIKFASQFYNDAVRDTRALRASWFTRMFRLAGHAPLPDYFAQPIADS